MEDQIKEEILEIDADQLEELLSGSDKLQPIELDLDEFDAEDFQRGIKDTSYIAGVITAFLNTGVSESFVLDYLLSKDSIDHNIKVAEINKSMNVEMSKNAKLAQEKFEL
jgi:hypothetical protein